MKRAAASKCYFLEASPQDLEFAAGDHILQDRGRGRRHTVTRDVPVAAQVLHKVTFLGYRQIHPYLRGLVTQTIYHGPPVTAFGFGGGDMAANGL